MTPCPAGRAALSVIGTTAALGAATLAYSLIEARCPVLRLLVGGEHRHVDAPPTRSPSRCCTWPTFT